MALIKLVLGCLLFASGNLFIDLFGIRQEFLHGSYQRESLFVFLQLLFPLFFPELVAGIQIFPVLPHD